MELLFICGDFFSAQSQKVLIVIFVVGRHPLVLSIITTRRTSTYVSLVTEITAELLSKSMSSPIPSFKLPLESLSRSLSMLSISNLLHGSFPVPFPVSFSLSLSNSLTESMSRSLPMSLSINQCHYWSQSPQRQRLRSNRSISHSQHEARDAAFDLKGNTSCEKDFHL